MSELLIRQVKQMDKKSEEFSKLYAAVNDMYFTFNDPDHYQKAASFLNLILNRADEHEIISLVFMYKELKTMLLKGNEAMSGQIGFEGTNIYFQFATSPQAIDRLQKFMGNMIVQTARQDQER